MPSNNIPSCICHGQQTKIGKSQQIGFVGGGASRQTFGPETSTRTGKIHCTVLNGSWREIHSDGVKGYGSNSKMRYRAIAYFYATAFSFHFFNKNLIQNSIQPCWHQHYKSAVSLS